MNLHLVEMWLDPTSSSQQRDYFSFLPKAHMVAMKADACEEPDQQEITKQLLSQQCVKCTEQIQFVYVVVVFSTASHIVW